MNRSRRAMVTSRSAAARLMIFEANASSVHRMKQSLKLGERENEFKIFIKVFIFLLSLISDIKHEMPTLHGRQKSIESLVFCFFFSMQEIVVSVE